MFINNWVVYCRTRVDFFTEIIKRGHSRGAWLTVNSKKNVHLLLAFFGEQIFILAVAISGFQILNLLNLFDIFPI